ncbi:hypothetical protein QTP88_025894 [Uroleucon formosanum]
MITILTIHKIIDFDGLVGEDSEEENCGSLNSNSSNDESTDDQNVFEANSIITPAHVVTPLNVRTASGPKDISQTR